MKFDSLKDGFSQAKAEERILEFWETNEVFSKANKLAENRPHFVFYEGPPTANGRPGIHHVLSRTVKDLVCRYKAMKGFRVDRKGGWDTHGLPVEIEVEKRLGLDTKQKVLDYGVGKFNQKCRESVFTYLEDWNKITRRIGYWLDLDDAYVTLHTDYVESVWHLLKSLFDKGLIYKGHRTTAFCPRCGTGLSSHEVAQGYQEVSDPSVYIKVRDLKDDFYYLVWTTTPWTLPSNAALCVKPDADYVMVEHEGQKVVLAEALVEKVLGEARTPLKTFRGTDLLDRKYEPVFDFYKDQEDKAFYVLSADFVTLEDGTGIVHVAPGFGADDYAVGLEHGLPILQAIEANGLFKDLAKPYNGMFIKDADKLIIKDLKRAGKLLKREQYKHNYPFCWRCDTALIYIARESWYIKTTEFKNELIKNNNAIKWHPDEIRSGRMHDWLENNVDWSLSRERFWGTPLPIWVCDDPQCGKLRAVGSIEQLQNEAPEQAGALSDGNGGFDLHKPGIDEIHLTCECGSTMTRTPEVIDCWFDSGSMPYAQWHYPFENKEVFDIKHPADFISEGVDQTRGWFYSLLAISTMLFEKPPFKNVVVLEFILDREGKKMSKSKGNVVDPFEEVDRFGADPVRWYLMATSNPWLPTKFDSSAVAEIIRKYFDTLRNTYSFFALYANIDEVVKRASDEKVTTEQFLEERAGEPERFDRWIMSRYNSLVKTVTESFDSYDITRAVRSIQHFVIEDLSNWYVRNNRRRYWAKGDDGSKMRAYLTLHRVLEGVCRLSAPVTPFISELLWKELMGANREELGLPLSVHMTEFPSSDEALIDSALERNMGLVEKIVSLGRAARARKNLKVRQPLSSLMVGLPEDDDFEKLGNDLEIVRDELNVKEVVSSSNLDQYVSYSAKLNFKTAGPKLGKLVKAAAAHISGLPGETVKEFVKKNAFEFESDGKSVILTSDEVDVSENERDGFAVEHDSGVTIALVTELTGELINEGFARELVSKIQNMRKSSGFEVTDKISIGVETTDRLKSAATLHEEFIKRETLAKSLMFLEQDAADGGTDWNINGEKATIVVAKV